MSATPGPAAATSAARAIVTGLVEAGVREVFLCPGSRSAPLAYALHGAAEAGAVRLHVRIDERSAGFAALGAGRVAAVPAAVVTTSGTAVANLLPAVLEARHARVAMIVVTADRPRRLRGTWANQTSDVQADLLAAAVLAREDREDRGDVDWEGAWAGLVAGMVRRAERGPGPVHLNVGFDDPLVPDDLSWRPLPGPGVGAGPAAPPATPVPVRLAAGPATVVVAGDGAGEGARRLAEAAGWPLLAEPSSGARRGPALVPCYRLLLDGDLGRRVQRAVVLGRPTLSRPVTRLLSRADVEVVMVAPDSAPGPQRPVTRMAAAAAPDGRGDPAWLGAWLSAGAAARRRLDEVLDAERAAVGRLSGPDVARAVVAATGPDTGLVLAASNPVRDADLAAGEVLAAFALANRGLSGIDGTVSTAAGAALASRGPVRLLVGDLAFLHDTNGLLIGPGEERPDLQIVVANDGGGGIFGLLEHGEDRFAPAFERLFATPQASDLAALCLAHGVPHTLASDPAGLRAALAPRPQGLGVVEVPVRRDRERALAGAVRSAVLTPT